MRCMFHSWCFWCQCDFGNLQFWVCSWSREIGWWACSIVSLRCWDSTLRWIEQISNLQWKHYPHTCFAQAWKFWLHWNIWPPTQTECLTVAFSWRWLRKGNLWATSGENTTSCKAKQLSQNGLQKVILPFKRSDSSWADCGTTRRSTNSGLIFLNGALLTSICRTQASVALSSCEAEVYAANGLMVENIFFPPVQVLNWRWKWGKQWGCATKVLHGFAGTGTDPQDWNRKVGAHQAVLFAEFAAS